MKFYHLHFQQSGLSFGLLSCVRTFATGVFLVLTYCGYSQEANGPSKVTIGPEDDLLAIYASRSQGDTVFLSEGVYRLAGQLKLKKGVNLMGAGPDKTILTTEAEHLLTETGGNTNWDKYLVCKYEPSSLEAPNLQRGNLFIEGFRIRSTTVIPLHGGIGIQNQANVEVRNVAVEGTYWSGLNILFVHKVKVMDSEFINCGRYVDTGEETFVYGVVNIGSSEKLLFHNNRVVDSRTLPNNSYILTSLGSRTTEWVGVSLTDNYFYALDPRSIWSKNGQVAPSYWQTYATSHFGTEIKNNYFGVPLSIIQEKRYSLGYHKYALQFTNNFVSSNGHMMELTLPNVVTMENVIWEARNKGEIGSAITNGSSSVKNKLSVSNFYLDTLAGEGFHEGAQWNTYSSQAGETAEVINIQLNKSKEHLQEIASQWGINQ